MTINRLAKSEASATARLRASEFAAIAREEGKFELAKEWDKRAAELGEERIPNGTTVRFQSDGTTKRVAVRHRT